MQNRITNLCSCWLQSVAIINFAMWRTSHQVRLLLPLSYLFVSTEDGAVKSAGVCRPDRKLLSTVEAAAKIGVCKASCSLIQQSCGGVACAAAIHQIEHALQIATKPVGLGCRVKPYKPINMHRQSYLA